MYPNYPDYKKVSSETEEFFSTLIKSDDYTHNFFFQKVDRLLHLTLHFPFGELVFTIKYPEKQIIDLVIKNDTFSSAFVGSLLNFIDTQKIFHLLTERINFMEAFADGEEEPHTGYLDIAIWWLYGEEGGYKEFMDRKNLKETSETLFVD